MKRFFIYITGSLFYGMLVFNCSSGGGDDAVDPDPKIETPPAAANLIFPSNNSECTEGANVSSTETEVTFDWYNANNTDSYQLFIKNLTTQSTVNYNTTESEKRVTLLKGTPYSWYVVSKNATSQTAQSSVWKFYSAGEAQSSYAPFPAELLEPGLKSELSASTTSTLLDWTAEDVDNDIKEYDVYFDTISSPDNKITTTSDSSFTVTVSSGNTYYWKIITKDEQNNSSESQVFEFSVK